VALRDFVYPPGGDDAPSALLLADVVRFLDAERWYASRGIPYHRGYLLHGAPGSGKTMLVHAIASELHMPVFAVDLTDPELTDDALAALFRTVRARSVVLIEHIDRAFDQNRQRGGVTSADSSSSAARGAAAGLTFSGPTFSGPRRLPD
jgi:chaperone BCS1